MTINLVTDSILLSPKIFVIIKIIPRLNSQKISKIIVKFDFHEKILKFRKQPRIQPHNFFREFPLNCPHKIFGVLPLSPKLSHHQHSSRCVGDCVGENGCKNITNKGWSFINNESICVTSQITNWFLYLNSLRILLLEFTCGLSINSPLYS